LDEEEETVPVLDIKAATKCLNKLISNYSPLRNKKRITASSRKWKLGSKSRIYSNLDCSTNETLSDNWERCYLASCWEGPSTVLPNLTACRVCTKSVLNVLTDGYRWEMKRASSQVQAADTGVQKQCCAQCMQLVRSLLQLGGGGGDVSSLVAAAKVSIAYTFQGIQSVFTLITTDHRWEISHGINYLRSSILDFELPLLACAVKIFLFFLAS
jgi:hypothetical protein